MRPINYFNGWIFIRLNGGTRRSCSAFTNRHNQYRVTVLARTKKRALELLKEYYPSANANFMRNYYSRMDCPPEGVEPSTEECIMIRISDPGHYVRLRPSMKEL